jgi:hypothetical protein
VFQTSAACLTIFFVQQHREVSKQLAENAKKEKQAVLKVPKAIYNTAKDKIKADLCAQRGLSEQLSGTRHGLLLFF